MHVRRRPALFTIALVLLLSLAPAAAAKPKSFKLTLLHNNDGESKLDTGDSVPRYGGAARFETVVDDLRDQADRGKKGERATLLVSSGDNFLAGLALLYGFETGPPWPDAIVANALDYDAMTLGNHEFDFGQARLAEYIEGVRDDIPFLAANLDFSEAIPPLNPDYEEGGRIVPSVVIRRGGERIGVIGLTTPDIATISSPGNVGIDSDLASVVNDEAKQMKRNGVDKVIVSAHLQGLAADEAVIPETKGVDVWIAGGGDDLLADPDDTLIPGDVPVGSYPSVVEDGKGDPVQVVSTAGEYKYVGRLTVRFSRQGEVTRVNGRKSGPVRVSGNPADDDFAAEDPRIRAVVDEVDAFVADLESQVIGETELDLLRTETGSPANDPIRRRESGFGNLVADSFLWKARELAATVPDAGEPQVAIANGGGIRADIPAGEINRAQTFATLPFFNQLVVVQDVPCESLRQLLERGVSGLPTIQGRFANIAGMRMQVDPTRPAQVVTSSPPVSIVTPGSRVRILWLDNGTPQDTTDDTQLIADGVAATGCEPVDLASTDFTVRDGDAYPFSGLGLQTFTSVGAIYNQAFEDFVAAPAASGGLDGIISAARYPTQPTGVERIDILGE